MNRLTCLTIAITFATSIAHAVKFQDWNFDEVGNHCIASTILKNGAINYQLEVSLEKSLHYPLEIIVRPSTSPSTHTALVATVGNNGTKFTFGKLIDGGNESFWQIPRGTDQIVTHLKQQSTLQMKTVGPTPITLAFSLKGSTAAINKLENTCKGGKDLFDKAFETAFLPTTISNVKADKVEPKHTEAMRRTFIRAYTAYLAQTELRNAKIALDQANVANQRELPRVQTELGKLKTTTLPGLEIKKKDIETQIGKLSGDITAKQAEIDVKKRELAATKIPLDQAEAVIAPLRPEYDRLDRIRSAAQTALDSTDYRLSQISSRISTLNSEITSLRSELSRLSSRLSSEQNAVNSANTARSQAQQKYDRYDENYEYQQSLNGNSSYQSSKRSRDQYENEARRLHGEIRRLQGDERQAQQNLQRCQATASADCSVFQAAYNTAVSNRATAESNHSTAVSNKQYYQRQMDDYEDQTRTNVHNQKVRLLDAVQAAETDLTNAQNAMNSTESRMRVISTVEIPTRDSELSSLRSEDASLDAIRPGQAAAVATAEADLNAYKLRVDWKPKADAVAKAQDAYNKIDWAIYYLNNDRAVLENQLASKNNDLTSTTNSIASTHDKISTAEQRIVELNATIANYNNEKARLDAELAASVTAFTDSQKEFGQQII